MALRLKDTTAIINQITNLIQGNSDCCYCVWVNSSFISSIPNYISHIALTDTPYNAWVGIFSDLILSDGSAEVHVNNESGPGNTTNYIIAPNTSVRIGYRRSGTTHFFYANGALIGSTVNDLSAVIFTEMLLGNDRFSIVLGDLLYWDFAAWDSSKSADTIQAQMASYGVSIDSVDLVIFTPLLNNLLDVSGNNNHWLGAGNFDFVANPLEFVMNASGGLLPNIIVLGNGENHEYNDLPVGTYGIVEEVPPGYIVTYVVSNGSPHDAITLAEGETVIVTVTNKQNPTINPNTSSGIYKIVKDKRNDTLWLENFTGTRDVKIPNPTYKTGLIGE